ncbi:TPA: ribosome small subunit-dependent GTPase A [Vibrio vulnificus]|nr:ribosome small subunit-dependent GTPase A [Vibrio vulnificus]EKO5191271.1 ribosome small subunit-dependent GTPase A [Vibrio vulnificus]ELO5516271.1 ribosome small subunit-dependent GTPase A [Vibrio vulnificus]MCU8244626.1 ribosome small subunit-dependent GTPase A [Vibrio vulnificus]MCU8358364.1 ribosome small subunit-dependent GTPase A [Vibrio vulnificus]
MNYTMTSSQPYTLTQLGWKPFFQQQLTLEDYENTQICRVIAHHRSGYQLCSEQGRFHLAIHHAQPKMTVGDWVLLDDQQQFKRLLERQSELSRKAAGSKIAEQLIATNVDTLFIVCSLNDDFNLSRIERYLSIAKEAHIEPVVVLTKADLSQQAEQNITQVKQLSAALWVEAVNALDPASVAALQPWCAKGRTVAFIGSSGVGKSTLTNTLLGVETQQTGGIREDDSKGRHTTTARSVHMIPDGALIIDTPGMRELQLADCSEGVSETFAEIETLAQHCRFKDCQHQQEPGCAVQQAIDCGTLEARRLQNYFKLQREQAYNASTFAEQRSRMKQFGKMCRHIQSDKQKLKTTY